MKPKKYLAFTLIELLVAMAITAIITTVVIANFHNANKSRAVQFAADTVVNVLREAQNDTLTGLQIVNSSCNQGNAPVAFFANFSAGTSDYTITGLDKCGSLTTLKSGQLPTKTRISSTGLVVDGTVQPSLSIKFTPPFGALEASGIGGFTSIIISVESSDSTSYSNVTISGVSGKIE